MSHSARFDRGHTDDLMSFLAASPSPYHAVANAAARLEKAGFRQVAETDAWDGESGGKYVLRGGALIAWYVPEGVSAATPYRIVGAHTDSPNLRVKPIPDTGNRGWRQIAVEIYGGTLLNTWLDRDLGLSGRVTLRDGSNRLVNVDRALMRVPQLAVHLDRSVNADGLKLDKQRHMTPIWGLGEVAEGDLIAFVEEEIGVPAGDVRGWDLMVHSIEAPAYLGRDHELLAGPRTDSRLSTSRCSPPSTTRRTAASPTPAPTARCSAPCWSARSSPAAAPTRTAPAPSPGRSACPPTPAMPSTPTTASGTSRGTTRCPTAAPS
jgi:aspartyl aminopeptidase